VIAPPIDLGNSSPAVDDLEAEELPELVSPSSQGSTPLSPNDASPPPPRAVNAHQMAASRSVVQRQQDDDDEEEEEEESGSEEEEEGSD
jgi:hypothetical protein